ncbi:hypothetical protein GALMADRAFT_53782 [Galerina marginata CBS 339.88]|uniref:DNA-directed DNA polymerase n=1 Tax=Galerina marginata (strain CBS 339.88) TaxID=685588 RepID=A0A067U075_GALM3|nr:hypothetical protein GALMADRAFT_53782 [Galerina marginata CBS 339.88]
MVSISQLFDAPNCVNFFCHQVKRNELGVQLLSRNLHAQVFKGVSFPAPSRAYVQISREHLQMHGLDPTQTSVLPNTSFRLPALQGSNISEHFHRIGAHAAEPWLTLAKTFASNELPPKPDSWHVQSGWTKYYHMPDGSSYGEHVETPTHDGKPEVMLTFDVETMPKYHPFSIMACAASPNAWYAWISPWLLGESEDPQQLIPLGDSNVSRVIVGHNVAYDRIRLLEEYNVHGTSNRFIDTMSLHVAAHGISSHQRPAWMKYRKSKQAEEEQREEAVEAVMGLMKTAPNIPSADVDADITADDIESKKWEDITSANSLADVAKLHCGIQMDKEIRNDLMTMDPGHIRDNVTDYLDYCANDVYVTHRVYSSTLPSFLAGCPHPVSFAGILTMGSSFLPVDENWEMYLKNAEAICSEMEEKVQTKLKKLAEDAKGLMDGEDHVWKTDPWLCQLDWTPKPRTKKVKPEKPPPVYWPKWYWDATKPKKGMPAGTLEVTVRSRIAPLLLRLSWSGHPLFYSREHGWTFRVPSDSKFQTRWTPVSFYDPADNALSEAVLSGGYIFYKVPHKDGEKANVASPLGKSFVKYAQNGTLKSPGDEAKEALDMNALCSYWISARDRIVNQLVIWQNSQRSLGFPSADESKKYGIILPQMITMGTVTRRAIEKTWLTASNAKKNRVGSELKAMVRAPKGYAIVGADVDSEELWISSCMGDAQFGLHGASAIGWMTLEGTKASGTDLHSKTASILGISRDQAKVFNYSRIYGAGMRHAILLLLQSNPNMLPEEAQKLAENLYASTKGKNTHRTDIFDRKFWFGGTESYLFNKLEEIALSDKPQTPALGCGVTYALSKEYLPAGFGSDYMPSRINWVVQSSGVDYLHLLIVSMSHLIAKYNIDARFLISVHDELRYLVAEEDKYRAALALQIANLWTRSLFAYKLGMDDLPQGVAFFSAVDIDHVLRKEVDMPCVTPSQPIPIPPGESLDITKVLNKTNGGSLRKDGLPMVEEINEDFEGHLDGYIEPNCLSHRSTSAAFLKAQATTDFGEVKGLAQQTTGKRFVGGMSAPKVRRKKAPIGTGEGFDWSEHVEHILSS